MFMNNHCLIIYAKWALHLRVVYWSGAEGGGVMVVQGSHIKGNLFTVQPTNHSSINRTSRYDKESNGSSCILIKPSEKSEL